MVESGRLDRLELKLDNLQSQSHQNHIELLSVISKRDAELDDEINAINLKLKEHDGHFGLMARLLGLGSILGGWVGLRDLWPRQ